MYVKSVQRVVTDVRYRCVAATLKIEQGILNEGNLSMTEHTKQEHPMGHLHIDPALEGTACDAHDWPDHGLPQRIVTEAKARHGAGGLNVCRECIDRARKVADSQRFPNGQLNDHDEGEIEIRVAADPKKKVVIIAFGKPVGWLALPPEHARAMMLMIEKKTNEIEPFIVQGTGIMVRTEVEGVVKNVEIETMSEPELRAFFADESADDLRNWLITVLRMINDARLLREK